MAFCINCGQELVEGAKFCYNCGDAIKDIERATSQRKPVFDGEIHKCPNCGELINSFVTTCPSCNYELRGVKASSVVKEFADKLERIETTRETQKTQSFIGILCGSDGQLTKTDEQKIGLIRSFSIPNTKEDIFEFMILAASNIDLKLYGLGDKGIITASQRAVSDAWLAKFEQAFQKARFMVGDSQEFLYISQLYERKIKEIRKKKRQFIMFMASLLAFLIFMMIGCFLMVIFLGRE